MLLVVILWEDPSRLAALVILKELVPAEVVVILPVLVTVAPVAELSANGVLDNGKFIDSGAISMKIFTESDYDEVKALTPNYVEQIDTIRNMIKNGVEEFYEIGPGNVLQGLLKRINPGVKRFGIDKFEEVEKYL